jgi:hypothetical protein
MDAPSTNEPTNENGAETEDDVLRAKVRDLRPEKDPIGAGVKRTVQTSETDSGRPE